MMQVIHQTGPLNKYVREIIEEYFERLDGHKVTNLYEMVLHEIEGPLLRAVMNHTKNNQSSAATILGINRGTLRKKLKQYKLEID
ncbi:MAG: DNA-binding transcriptional regulator Fis [Coxiellaceae bacterium]|jgi:Fis family transcriptional regulator|nr:DNA-binding transcriptional regulator Fis [Coxiellaceae bacterium]